MHKILEAYDFSGGLNNLYAPYLISLKEMADCQNVTLREAGKVKTRLGHDNYCTLTAVSGLTVVDDCDDLVDWTVDDKGSLALDAVNYYEATNSIKNTRTTGIEIDDCDNAALWSGHVEIDTSEQTEGTGCVEDSVTLGCVVDTCEALTGWSGWPSATLSLVTDSAGAPGSYAIYAYGWPSPSAYKTIVGDYSAYENSARLYLWLKNTGDPEVEIRLETDASNYYTATIDMADYERGYYDPWYEAYALKSDFTAVGSPSWANITTVRLIGTASFTFDYIHWREKERTTLGTTNRVTWTPAAAEDYSMLADDAKIRLYVEYPAGFNSCSAHCRAYTGAHYYTVSQSLDSYTPAAWNELGLLKGDFTVGSGTPDWGDVDDLRFYFTFSYTNYQDPGTVVTWYWDDIDWMELTIESTVTMDWSGGHQDFSAVADDGEFSLWFRYHALGSGLDSAGKVKMYFYDSTAYFESEDMPYDVGTEDVFQKVSTAKGDFTESGSPLWSDLDTMVIVFTHTLSDYDLGTSMYFHYDYITLQAQSNANAIRGLYEFRDRDGTTVKHIACLGSKIYDITDPDAPAEKQGGAMTSGYDYTFATIGDKVFAANGQDHVQYWDGGAGNFAAVGAHTWPAASPNDDTPPKCKYLCVHKDRLWCFGLTASGYESYLVFGDLGDPTGGAGVWPVNNWFWVGPDAGSIPTGICVFSDTLVLFTRRHIYLLYGSSEADFEMAELEDCPGCIAPKSIVVTDHGVYYLALDGIRLFTGNGSVVVSDNIRGTLLGEVELEKMSSAVGAYFDGTYRLWMVEDGGESSSLYPDMAMVYDPAMKAWVRWRSPLFINVFAILGDLLYAGRVMSPSVMRCDIGYSDDGLPIETIIQTGQLNCGVPEIDKYFHHLYVSADSVAGDYDLNVVTETQDDNENTEYDVELQDLVLEIVRDRTTIALWGGYLQVTFSHNGANEPIALLGYSLGYKVKKVK